jgi:hypothetical protein
MPQRNQCIAMLNKQKCLFFFTRTENGRAEQVLLGVGTSGMGENVGRGYRKIKMVKILCIHVHKNVYIHIWNNENC